MQNKKILSEHLLDFAVNSIKLTSKIKKTFIDSIFQIN
jgi:hypothetical protein